MSNAKVSGLAIVGAAIGLVYGAQGAIINPGFTQGADGFTGWTTPGTYNWGTGPVTLAQSVIIGTNPLNAGSPGYEQGDFASGGLIPVWPGGTPTTQFLELQGGASGTWVTVSQTITLGAGQTASGYFALNAGAQLDPVANDQAQVAINSVGLLGANIAQGSFYDPVTSASSFSGWSAWSFTAPSSGAYELDLQVFSAQPTGKFVSFGDFSPISISSVPETSTIVSGGLGVLLALVPLARRRQQS